MSMRIRDPAHISIDDISLVTTDHDHSSWVANYSKLISSVFLCERHCIVQQNTFRGHSTNISASKISRYTVIEV